MSIVSQRMHSFCRKHASQSPEEFVIRLGALVEYRGKARYVIEPGNVKRIHKHAFTAYQEHAVIRHGSRPTMMLSTDDFSADDLPSVIYVAEGSAAEKRCKERGWYYKTYRY